jgi:hypothetical protein
MNVLIVSAHPVNAQSNRRELWIRLQGDESMTTQGHAFALANSRRGILPHWLKRPSAARYY